jgi:hypothetical protein
VKRLRLATALIALAAYALLASSCMTAYRKSVGASQDQVYIRIYITNFNVAWQAVLDSLKNSPLDVSNREGGFVQTKWTDNTSEKNFTDSFGGAPAYLKAQYRFRVSVATAFYNGQPAVKVTTQKEQLVQRDVLESFRAVESDSIDENTLLYRIGRIIYMKMKLAKLEEDKTRKAIESSGF